MPRLGRVMSRATAQAQRTINKATYDAYSKARSRGKFMGAGVDSSSMKMAMDVLDKFPREMHYEVVRKAGRAAAIVVRETANTMLAIDSAPRGPNQGQYPGDSKETGTYEHKSIEQRGERDGRASMVDKVGIKPKATDRGYLHMIGPRRPWGNQAWVLEFGGVIQLWGRDQFYHLMPRPFMEHAGENTKAVQSSEFIKKMKEEWVNW